MLPEINVIPLPHTIKYNMRFVTCDICKLLKDVNNHLTRCPSCNILQCNDCETLHIEGTKITLSCANCGAFTGTGTPDYISDEDREKLK